MALRKTGPTGQARGFPRRTVNETNRSGTDALFEFLEGIADGAGDATPPLAPLAAARPSFRP